MSTFFTSVLPQLGNDWFAGQQGASQLGLQKAQMDLAKQQAALQPQFLRAEIAQMQQQGQYQKAQQQLQMLDYQLRNQQLQQQIQQANLANMPLYERYQREFGQPAKTPEDIARFAGEPAPYKPETIQQALAQAAVNPDQTQFNEITARVQKWITTNPDGTPSSQADQIEKSRMIGITGSMTVPMTPADRMMIDNNRIARQEQNWEIRNRLSIPARTAQEKAALAAVKGDPDFISASKESDRINGEIKKIEAEKVTPVKTTFGTRPPNEEEMQGFDLREAGLDSQLEDATQAMRNVYARHGFNPDGTWGGSIEAPSSSGGDNTGGGNTQNNAPQNNPPADLNINQPAAQGIDPQTQQQMAEDKDWNFMKGTMKGMMWPISGMASIGRRIGTYVPAFPTIWRPPTYFNKQGLAAQSKSESGGNPQAQNPASTASGKYQFLDSTWREYQAKYNQQFGTNYNYSRAADAPADVQDKIASITPVSNWGGSWAGSKGRNAANPAMTQGTPVVP
jgi:hypothetical protein